MTKSVIGGFLKIPKKSKYSEENDYQNNEKNKKSHKKRGNRSNRFDDSDTNTVLDSSDEYDCDDFQFVDINKK